MIMMMIKRDYVIITALPKYGNNGIAFVLNVLEWMRLDCL